MITSEVFGVDDVERNMCEKVFLIHEADPQSLSLAISIFACVVCPSVRTSVSTFQNLAQQNNFQARLWDVGLAEWIIDGTHVLYFHFRCQVCGHESVRFDPFTFLSLPLPMESSIHIEIIGNLIKYF